MWMEKTDFRPGKSSTSKVFKPAHKKLVSRQFVDTSINTNLRQTHCLPSRGQSFPTPWTRPWRWRRSHWDCPRPWTAHSTVTHNRNILLTIISWRIGTGFEIVCRRMCIYKLCTSFLNILFLTDIIYLNECHLRR